MSRIKLLTVLSELVVRQSSFKLVTVAGISIDSMPLWYNIALESEVRPDGIMKDFRELHPPKAHIPIEDTLSGTLISLSAEQYAKLPKPM